MPVGKAGCELANCDSPTGYVMHFLAILSKLQWHDSVDLSSVYTDCSFSSFKAVYMHQEA